MSLTLWSTCQPGWEVGVILRNLGTWLLPLLELWVVDNLLPKHIELPHVLYLAVHLVQLATWLGTGGHTETCRYLGTPSSRSYGWLITFSLNM